MGLKLQKSAGGDGKVWPVCPEGNHRACIVRVIELGTQTENKFGSTTETVSRLKVFVVYELLDEDAPASGPWVIGRMYTASSYKDAPLMKVVSSALGKAIGEDEEPDLETIVGRTVMINVEHTAKGEKVYENVKDATPVAKALRSALVEPHYTPVYESLGKHSPADWIPRIYGQKVADLIGQCEEMRQRPASSAKRPPDDEDTPF